MKMKPAFLTVLAALMACRYCLADHPLDVADRALSEGNSGQAVAMYAHANSELPTAEGYNNLGIALERAGDFRNAVIAYEQSLSLPDANEETSLNFKRARLRAGAQACLPVAALVFLGLITVFALLWLTGRIVRARHRLRQKLKYEGVTLVAMSHQVQCHDGQYQPDGKVYYDSERIAFEANLSLPDRHDSYTLQLDLEIIQPDGRSWRTLRESIDAVQVEGMTVRFEIENLGELLDQSGTWQAQLVLRNVEKTLGQMEFVVVTRNDLIADLEAVDARLIAVSGKQAEAESVIFPHVEAVVPYAIIRPRSCHPCKFAGMQVRLELVNTDKGGDAESRTFPLELADGVMQFCQASRSIAGDPISRQLGGWEFRLFVENRILAPIPFVITSHEQALESIRVKSFNIAQTRASGQVSAVAGVAYVQDLRSLSPVITVSTRFPSRHVRYRMTLGICLNDEPIEGVEWALAFTKQSHQLIPGEFVPPRLQENQETVKVSFVLMVEGRTLGVREVLLRRNPTRCADVQGRIAAAPSSLELDYDAEAVRILDTARVSH